MLAATVEDHELIDPTLTPERLLYRLFHEEGVRVMPPLPIRAHCGCTRARVETMLKSFGADELSDMREADGAVTVTCEYCSTKYRFEPDEVGRFSVLACGFYQASAPASSPLRPFRPPPPQGFFDRWGGEVLFHAPPSLRRASNSTAKPADLMRTMVSSRWLRSRVSITT